MRKLTAEEFPEQYAVIKEIMNDIGIECPIFVYKDNVYNGSSIKKGITLTSAVINDFKEHPYVLRFLAGHELTHYKNKDSGHPGITFFSAFFYFVGTKRLFRATQAHYLLQEMRANIDGASYAKLSPNEIINSQNEIQNKNKNNTNRAHNYKKGYPDREMIKSYALRYKWFDRAIAQEILKDYCEVLKIRRPEKFIQSALAKFFDK